MDRKVSDARSDLEQMLIDGTVEPKALPLSLLEDITGGFSSDQEIGRGGFAVVYKGILGDRAVAVKRLSNAFMDEKEFEREVECLMRVKHKNVIRFLGYCADRQGRMERYDGKLLMADVHQRLLCFEYVPNGSVDKYIIDPYREWGICYNIIKGVCEGIHSLHENHIIHLDIKPANILLTNNMEPKIIDFGVSICLDEIQSHHITESTPGTIGYLAPELIERGEVAPSNDLYSLGAVIFEILTGQKGGKAIENVLESWSDQLEISQQETLCDQIRICYEIALECRELNPKKTPASARDIIDRLHERECIQALAASFTSGAAVTESNGKSKTDAPRVSHSHLIPTFRRGAHRRRPVAAGPARPSKLSEAYSSCHAGKIYVSPKLVYLKVSVLAAQDLIPTKKGRPLAAKIQMGNQIRRTRPLGGTGNPEWSEEFMFVACEPFEDPLVVTVEERVAAGRDEPVGRVIIPVAPPYVTRNDLAKSVPSRWFSLWCGMMVDEAAASNVKETASSKIHLKMSLETAYHVLDESSYNMSDMRPAAKRLWKPSIGILDLGIINAHGLGSDKNTYCVAKYGLKWVRTRTLLATAAPRYNEQYTWEVYDLSTVITVAVFGHGIGDTQHQRIGKVRVRLARLESGRAYAHSYPLMAVSPSGIKKNGELYLAVRFTCTAWANLLAQYGRPLLPKAHYTNPIPVLELDYLRLQATEIVATRLGKAEPPLPREVVEYMLDVDSHVFSMRRSKVNLYRITSFFSDVVAVGRWFDGVCKWKNPLTTVLVHVLFLALVCYPELILPTVFLCTIMIWAWNYRRRPQRPPHVDMLLSQAELAHLQNMLEVESHRSQPPHINTVHPDELDEELDTFPTSKPDDIVRIRYDRLRNIVGRLQSVVGDLATQVEHVESLFRWHDPRATAVFIALALLVAVALYLTPFQLVVTVIGLYFLRPPWLRSRNNLLFNLYARLPSKDDVML